MMARGALPLLLAAFLVAAGCGDDPVQSEPFDLAGAWTYSATSLTGILPEDTEAFPGQKISVTCSVSPTPMVLTGSNASFVGQFSEATLACQLLNEDAQEVDTEVVGPVSGSVANGQVESDAVSFSFVPGVASIAAWANEGMVDSASASGTVQMQTVIAGETVQLSGRWVASRN